MRLCKTARARLKNRVTPKIMMTTVIMRPVVHPSGGPACTPVEDEAFETAHLLVAPRSLGAAANGLTLEIRACNVLITQPCA